MIQTRLINPIKICQNIRDRLYNQEIYLTILGEQGSGKSTLSNALLCGKDIFPMDVNETTNCMTFVTGIDESIYEYAEIEFENDKTKTGPLTEEFLRPYVDEQSNPENQKGVARVKCYAHVDWLEKAGVWFVDTPGVESLNSRNHELTYAFLPRITVAIYLARVNPAITNTELNFLSAIWEKRPMMFFAMNRYDESDDEVDESRIYTLDALKRLDEDNAEAKDEVLNYDLYTIDVIQAYNAYEDDDPEEIKVELEESGAKKLIQDMSRNLEGKLNKTRIQSALQSLEHHVIRKLSELTIRCDTITKDYRVQKEQALKDQLDKERAYRSSQKDLRELVKKTKMSLKVFMRMY